MKKINNVIIIGCSIPSLYAGLKFVDIGYKVTILERKNSLQLKKNTFAYNNLNIYNDNHKNYIALLKRFDIKGERLDDIKFDPKLYVLINSVIQKAKLIPNNILITHTFTSLCKYIMNEKEFDELNAYENTFSGLFNVISALDCINIFTYDLTDQCSYFYISNAQINELINKMITQFTMKYGKIIMNNDVKNIKYIKKKYIVHTNMHYSPSCDILLTTISKENLTSFGFWNNDQKVLLNAVWAINATIIKNAMDKLIFVPSVNDHNDSRQLLLEELHIVCPLFAHKSRQIYLWNNGINSVLIRERIKSMYNDKFIICSESYSKNNMFISYSLDYVDSVLNKL
jgi:hypothetical protein